MATQDLKFVQDIYKMKDGRNEVYYLKIKAIDDDGNESVLLDHVNNKGATGSKQLQSLLNRFKNDYSQFIIEEYRSFSNGSTGANTPVQTHTIELKSFKPVKADSNELFGMFGGFQGFIGFTREQARIEGENQAFNARLDELRGQNGQMLAKLGTYEAEIKKLESDLRRKDDLTREMKWKYEDQIRDLQNENDKELRKYKGQSAIVTAGVQGLGSLLMKKLNVSGADLAGFLGLETNETDNTPSQPTGNIQNVEVEQVGNVDPEIKQKADIIHSWLLRTDAKTMQKVFEIFDNISKSEQNLNDIYELTTSTDEVQY
jgi:hypothetical protein